MHDISVIIVAGGRGTRIGGSVPKQFQVLAGLPLYQYSLHSFLEAGIADIIVVVPKEFTEHVAIDVATVTQAVQVAEGGPQRRDSVACGFALVGKEVSTILIHDAARPFLPLSMISRVAIAAQNHGAALATLPVADTIKRSEDSVTVTSTVNRTGLFLAQTPQGFSYDILSKIVALDGSGIPLTDEAMAAEQIGAMPRLVQGNVFCFKITTRDDLAMAHALHGLLKEKGAHDADWSWLRRTPAS
jgi:2-C-methyl-D-erythritol 4-phosphate cytidylyltransferase